MEDYNTSDSGDDEQTVNKQTNRHEKDKEKDDGMSTKNCDKDANGEPCAICLCNMDTDIGSPDMCDHSFCLECLLEWAKNNNSCPKDRVPFLQVFVKRRIGGKIIKVLPIEEVNPQRMSADEEDLTFCEICGSSDREDTMLLCDECDGGFHLECLTPRLTAVPVDEWFCAGCSSLQQTVFAVAPDIDFNEVNSLIEDGEDMTRDLPPRRRMNVPRVLPRTRASERVRSRITNARINRAANNQTFREQLLRAISTPKSRIAEVLGIKKSKRPWQLSVPAMKNPKASLADSVNRLRMQKLSAGVPSLSLLGSNFELDYVPECDDDDGDGALIGVRRTSNLSGNAQARRKAAVLLRTLPSQRRPSPSFSSGQSANILDSIFENQTNLLSRRYLNESGNVVRRPKLVDLSKVKAVVKKSANGESGSVEGKPEAQERHESRDGREGGQRATSEDPTGAVAYSSYLQERRRSEASTDYQPLKTVTEPKKKKNSKDKPEDEVDLYSDVEPEAWDDLESMSSPEYEDEKTPDKNDQEDEPSSEDDLVIDDSINTDTTNRKPAVVPIKNGFSDGLPGMQEYEESGLEEVSDTEVQDVDRSINSSISLSDSNMEDDVIITKVAEPETKESSRKTAPPNVGMGLDSLEVETISDSEESFEDENIEEGEIFCEIPSKLPLIRPRVNLQFRKPLEMITSLKEFEGDYEEGEIVDETAAASAKRDKREKAKEEVDKVVNQPLDDPVEGTGNDGIEPEVSHPVESVPIAVEDGPTDLKESPPKRISEDKKHQEKTDKETLGDKRQDVSFKKISKSTKVRNYRDNENESHRRKTSKDRDREEKIPKEKNKRKWSPDRNQRGHNKRRRGRSKDRDSASREPKRKEIERYNVRQMISKKQEERKKKDQFGRDVSLRDLETSRSRTPTRGRDSRGRRKSRSRSRFRRSSSRKSRRRKRGRSYSSSTSSSSSSSSSSSFSSSSGSSSRSSSSSPPRKKRDRHRPESKGSKKGDKKKELAKPKERAKDKKEVLPPSDRKEGKKDKLSDTDDTKVEKVRRKKRKEKSPLQSKEVFQSGGSIMVSVNFSRNQVKEGKEPKKKKDREPKSEIAAKPKLQPEDAFNWAAPGAESPAGKRTPLQDEPMWSPENIAAQTKNAASPDMCDLDIIMVTPPPQEPILISDSEDEGITRLPLDLGAKPVSPQIRNQGPKTPPEPGVKFTLSTKQSLKPISNPLGDGEEERLLHVRGPNTPPGPPPESDESGGRVKSPRMPDSINSSPEPDVYDPFDPTKSPSPQGSPPLSNRETSKETIEISDSPEKGASPSFPSNKSHSTPPPPLPSESPELEEKPPEPQKLPEEEPRPAPIAVIGSIPTSIAHPPTCIPALFPSTALPLTQNASMLAPPAGVMHQIFAALPPNVANILYPAGARAAAGNLMRPPPVSHSILTPDLSRPPPLAGILPPGLLPQNFAPKFRANQNGKPFAPDFIDPETGSPTSPDSSDASDIFEPPSPHRHTGDKISPRKGRPTVGSQKKPTDKFDSLFGSDSRAPKPHQKSKQHHTSNKTPIKCSGKLAAELDEEIPSSAVELQVKEKLLKKIQRQERVVEEVKLCLKPFYNKKTVSKDDYKEIMKKCVHKVCHNKSGEINPIKIRSLVEGYIKKVKYYRKKFGGPPGCLAPPGVSDPPPPGFAISKSYPGKGKP